MATSAQKAALAASKNNYYDSKNNTASAKKNYNNAYNDYKTALNKGYTEGKTTKSYRSQSEKALSAAKAMGDFSYKSNYTDKITGLLDKAENMKFGMNYSLTDDPAYQSYRDQYVHNGQLAAQEAAGNAVAQTGGYGSTAATAASQQAYNESLTQLNNIVPQLYSQAYEREWNKFTDEKNTLQELAAAYQAQDTNEYNQALSTWNNNFNQYITIAQEYQKKYEYLDSAERAEYENKLDGLYNLLTVSQNQYNTNQSLEQSALNSYTGTANDIANYEETVRSNRASEAAAAAQLNETKRMNDYTIAANKTSGSASKNKSSNSSINIPQGMYQQIGMNRSDEGRANAIEKLLKQGTITNAEAKYLLDYFKLS